MIVTLVMIITILLIGAALWAPVESLRWWANDGASTRFASPQGFPSDVADSRQCYIVYFSGIGAVSTTVSERGEKPLLTAIADRLDGEHVVSDFYPYSPANVGLLTGRWSSRWWQLINRMGDRRHTGLAAQLIYLRNALQFAVSADRRYGPLYSLGVAQAVWQELLESGYRPADRRPIILLGWSGGAQIAVGAASFLADAGMPIHVISLAGVYSSDPGLDRISSMWHLYGSKDWVPHIGSIISAGRWPWVRGSDYRHAVASGKIRRRCLGPMRHLGRGSYLSSAPMSEAGMSYREATIEAIVDVIVEAGLASRATPAPPQADLPR